MNSNSFHLRLPSYALYVCRRRYNGLIAIPIPPVTPSDARPRLMEKLRRSEPSVSSVPSSTTSPLPLSLTMPSKAPWDPSTRTRSVDESSNTDAKPKGQHRWTGLFGESGYLWENIDPAKAIWPMTIWCFLTGYMSVFHSPTSLRKPANTNTDDTSLFLV